MSFLCGASWLSPPVLQGLPKSPLLGSNLSHLSHPLSPICFPPPHSRSFLSITTFFPTAPSHSSSRYPLAHSLTWCVAWEAINIWRMNAFLLLKMKYTSKTSKRWKILVFVWVFYNKTQGQFFTNLWNWEDLSSLPSHLCFNIVHLLFYTWSCVYWTLVWAN